MMETSKSMRKFNLGGCSVSLLDGGRFKLDGGAMFGIIPKPVWSRAIPADELNRIQLACNCLLVEWEAAHQRRVLIETGCGDKYSEKERGFFDIRPQRWLLQSLQAAAIDPRSITDVIVSHLHFDHAGGLTWEADGRLLPTFPNARVHVQRREYEDAKAGFGAMKTTYRPENIAPLDESDAWCLHDGELECLPGIRLLPTPGHTPGHQSVLVSGRERAVLFAGDAMPTAAHLGAPYNMAYDLYPLENRDSKAKFLRQAADEDWLICIDHEVQAPLVRARAHQDWFLLTPET